MLSRIQFSLIGDLEMKIPEYADHVTLVSAANMADRDAASSYTRKLVLNFLEKIFIAVVLFNKKPLDKSWLEDLA